ncbi:hypothetical protein BDV95DRAFT_500754 [Massariosphaeria phaeospora]|uniref:RNase MRP protein 1 RNA binding domain-containing protein n=1 Tax=Massariosphaeria phaeospora TaxID=100035 RepID=A0A7C8IAC7_9PLEO|nr:hypothetical protein BDV95DRAFT_500754 [Massariosphaeria phaeospora]
MERNTITPQISARPLLNATTKDRQNLLDIQELLNRLFVRNRNQHRRNHWFKSLAQFRKQLSLLLSELETEKKTSLPEKIEQRLRYWDDRCIHNWYLHFTQLVAVGPFAVAGLVLMACTARVCRITGITNLYEEIGSEDMKMILGAVDDGEIANEFGGLLDPEEEWGEVVEREEDEA